MIKQTLILLPLITTSLPSFASCTSPLVEVSGFAQSFIFDSKIRNATITVSYLNGALPDIKTTTDSNGRFSICVLKNSYITLNLIKKSSSPFNNYKSTQTGTYFVPNSGLNGKYHEISFQVPRMLAFNLLKTIIEKERGVKLNTKDCQVVTTITAYHKTLYDDPQGIAGAKVTLNGTVLPRPDYQKPYYFSIFLKKTWPFSSHRTITSKDGGILIYNITPSSNPIEISAYKNGTEFTKTQFLCKQGAFINISPPRSPSAEATKIPQSLT